MAETIRLAVTVKAYPAGSSRYGEAVCVAGIRTDKARPEWVRLYPVDFRDLPPSQQFRKWSEIELAVRPSSDTRPESLKPDTATITSLRELGTQRNWRARRSLVEPLLVGSMCEVYERQQVDGTSLAAFRPHDVQDVVVQQEAAEWTPEELSRLSQLNLFAQDKELLEKVPWRWKYHYSCGGSCKGHEQSIIDWEIHQAWRKWRLRYGPQEAVEQVRKKWLAIAGPGWDTVFFVGNMHRHQTSFLILGTYYPRAETPSEDVEHLQLGL